MKKKPLHYELHPANPPALTARQKAEIRTLAAEPDRDINYTDIPPLDDSFWKRAVRNPFYKPTSGRSG